MRKYVLIIGFISLLLLSACGKKNLTDYLNVSFSGVDGVGKMEYAIDHDALFDDLFDFEDEESYEAMNAIYSGHKIEVDESTGLSNGDKVTIEVAVNNKKTKKVKGGKKKITVEDLRDPVDVTEYIEVSFSGLDSQGKIDYELSETQMLKDIFGEYYENDLDEDTESELDNLDSAYTIEFDKESGLSNGDKVKVTVKVDGDKTKVITNGEKEFTVKDLGEATKLTTEEVEKHLVLNFNGVSGRGEAKIDNSFGQPLNYFSFEIENDGELSNGDKAKLVWNEDKEADLNSQGYVIDKDFDPTFEVKGLDIVAEKATDIKNLKDIKRMIKEEADRKYEDFPMSGRTYEIKEERVMYREFDTGKNETNTWSSREAANHGNLITIYTIEKSVDDELDDTFTAVIGYGKITLDDKGKANVADIELFNDERDNSYSLDSVIQLYEGYGYEEVKE